jgi:hypothetical protein
MQDTFLFGFVHIVACRDPLLGNDCETNSETMPASMQQVPDKQQLDYYRGTVFSTRSVSRCYKQDDWSSCQLWDIRVKICYQETTSEDRRFYVCCSV